MYNPVGSHGAGFLIRTLYEKLGRDPRLKRILYGGATGFASRGLTLLVSVITIPMAVRYLGAEQYGLWVTIAGVDAILWALDLGLSSTLTNFIAKASAQDDGALAQEYFSTAFWMSSLITAFLILSFLVASHFVNWRSFFHVSSDALAEQARLCVLISVIAALVSLPLNLITRVLAGYQQVHVANYFSMVSSLMTLLAIAGGVLLRFSLVGLMAAYCGLWLLGPLALNVWVVTVSKPWIKPWPRMVRRSHVMDLFREGLLFFVIQIATVVIFNSDNLVITHYLGAGKVTPYSVAWRLITYATLLQSILVPAAWPALTEAYHRGDISWVRGTFQSLSRKSLLAVGSAALLFALLGRWIVHLWIGPAAVPDAGLMWLMALWAVISCYTSNQALLLVALGRLKLQTVVAVLAAALNLPLSIYLVQRIGTRGAIAATILSFLFMMLLPQEREVRRILHELKVRPDLVRA